MFIPDLGSNVYGIRIRIKEIKYFTLKIVSKLPGCELFPHPGSGSQVQGQKSTESTVPLLVSTHSSALPVIQTHDLLTRSQFYEQLNCARGIVWVSADFSTAHSFLQCFSFWYRTEHESGSDHLPCCWVSESASRMPSYKLYTVRQVFYVRQQITQRSPRQKT